jgi:glycerol-3-phosphate dehydrogenase
MVCVSGGKLTNYRLMAAEVVDKVFKKLPNVSFQASWTKHLMLGGWSDKNNFLTLSATILAKGRQAGIEPASLEHLLATYGADAQKIVDIVAQDPSLNKRICPDFPPIMAEIPYCVNCEMVVSLEDLLLRRLRLGILHQRQCLEAAPKVAEMMQQLCKWDKVRLEFELSALQDTLQQHLDTTLSSSAIG